MWLNELKDLYSESWNVSSPNLPGDAKGMKPPSETMDSLRMKGIFGAGDSPSNRYSVSQASGQNPMEQEEDQMISKHSVLRILNAGIEKLDSVNRLDQSALLSLSEIKKIIEKL
jgi:hypothetical protein